MLNLLLIIGNLEIGGAQNMVFELVNNLNKDSIKVAVLCCSAKCGSVIEEKLESICSVEYLNLSGRTTPLSMVKVLRKISKMKPDVVHAHLGGVNFALPWCLLNRKKIIVTAHTKPEKAFPSRTEKLVRIALQRKLLVLVAVSNENQERCKAYFSTDDTYCIAINNGVDLNRYFQEQHKKRTFINVARHDNNKNQKLIIECFSKLVKEYDDIRLVLLGDGPTHSQLKKIVYDKGIEKVVELPGNVPNPEKYLSVSDFYVQSSHREAMPLSALEAMATGLPIISTDVGGMKDIVDGNGLLVEDGNEKAFEEGMRYFLRAPRKELESMGKRSMEIVSSYSSEHMAEQYAKEYYRIMEIL